MSRKVNVNVNVNKGCWAPRWTLVMQTPLHWRWKGSKLMMKPFPFKKVSWVQIIQFYQKWAVYTIWTVHTDNKHDVTQRFLKCVPRIPRDPRPVPKWSVDIFGWWLLLRLL